MPELRDAKWELHAGGDTWRLPLGENLTRNADNMARQLFTSVTLENAPNDAAIPGVDATLIPKMTAFEQSSGAFAWTEATTSIVMQWTLKDAKNGVIWADTLRADVKGSLGTAFTRNANTDKRTAEAIEKVFHDSFAAISAAPEIRKLAANKR